jgi:hypothetical protein
VVKTRIVKIDSCLYFFTSDFFISHPTSLEVQLSGSGVIVGGANDEKRDPVYQTLVPGDNAKSSYRRGVRSTSLHTKYPR